MTALRVLGWMMAMTAAAFAQDVTPHFEVGAFGGGQFWKVNRGTYPLPLKLEPGFVYGGRAGYDFSSRWGAEATLARAGNKETFDLSERAGLPRAGFGARSLQLMAGPMFYLRSASPRYRPYLTAGPALQRFSPTGDGRQAAADLRQYRLGAVTLDDNFTGGFFYGGGLKAWLTPRVNARVDVRGLLSLNSHIRYFGRPESDIVLPSGGAGHGLQLTAGLGYAIGASGWNGAGAVTPRTDSFRVQVSGPSKDVYQGEQARFSASSDAPDGNQVKYLWRLNDQNIGGGESISIDTSILPPGSYPVTVIATAPRRGSAKANGTLTVLPAEARALNLTLTPPPARIFPGDIAPFRAKADGPDASSVTYAWLVDGMPAGSGDMIAIDTKNLKPGTYPVEVTASAAGFKTNKGASVLAISERRPPQIRFRLPSGDVQYGDKVPLVADVQRGEGGGAPGAVKFTASDGTLSGNELDTSTMQFDTATPGHQRKSVTLTATATDDKGLTSRVNAALTVVRTVTAEATRLPDVVFPVNNSRVNNCGKRVLLEELKAYLDRDPSGRVILVAHLDRGELKPVGQRRALNAAAVITAGTGICLGVDPKQVLIGLAGYGQASEPMPYLCGTSTQEKVSSQRGRVVRMNDKRSAYRRVEVWFVPAAAPLPPNLGQLRTAASYKISTLSCPK